MPSGNIAAIETDEFSYLLVLDPAGWGDALDLCPQYGDGYRLANIVGQHELDSIAPALIRLQQQQQQS